MKIASAAVAATFLVAVVPPLPAYAQSGCGTEVRGVCGEAGNEDFQLTGQQPTSGGAQVKPVSGGHGPQRRSYVEKVYVPTCTGNDLSENGVLCGAAVMTCPVEGEIRFWVYTREVTIATGAATPWARVTEPSSVCIGPEDPVIDPSVAIPAIVQRDFKRVVVVKGVAEVSPKPDTLVNIPTVFTTSAPGRYDIPLTLLGQSVVITAKAERYTWHFGDGESATSTAPEGRVEHEYRRAASRRAYVVIEWSGRFSIDGGASQPITGTATTAGDPIAIEVKQARTELVRD